MIYDQDICKIRNIGIKHTGKKFGAYLFWEKIYCIKKTTDINR